MSAFHRVDDVRTMPAQRFIDFALRLPAYKGILRALIEGEAHREYESQAPAGARRPASRDRVVASDAGTLRTDPAFAGMIEVKGA